MYSESIDREGLVVIRRDNEDIESLIRRFKKKVNRSGIMKELRCKEFYEKPSIAKRRKRNEAKMRKIKEEIKMKRGVKNDQSDK